MLEEPLLFVTHSWPLLSCSEVWANNSAGFLENANTVKQEQSETEYLHVTCYHKSKFLFSQWRERKEAAGPAAQSGACGGDGFDVETGLNAAKHTL